MSHPPTYKDYNKCFNDLLNKVFPEKRDGISVTTYKVETTTKSSNSSVVSTISREENNPIFGSLNPKINAAQNLDVNVKVDTKGVVDIEVVEDKLKFGKLTLLGKIDDKRPFIGGTVQYSANWGTFVVHGLYPAQGRTASKKNGHLEASTVLAHQNVLLALSGKLVFTDSANQKVVVPDNVEGAIGWQDADISANIFAQLKPADHSTIYGLSYFQRIKKLQTDVGAKFALKHSSHNEYEVSAVVGKQFDAATFAKARLDTNGNAHVGITHRINDQTKLDLGVTANLVNTVAAPKTNIALAFTY